MTVVDPNWDFEEAVAALSARYRPGGLVSGQARNRLIEVWGQLVGRDRALREVDQAIARHGSLSRAATALHCSTSTLRDFRSLFERLPKQSRGSASRLEIGDVIGRWTLRKQLGSGGNATVWLARNAARQEAAIKVPHPQRYRATTRKRFQDEVEAHRLLVGVAGVMPILESCVPGHFDRKVLPWFVMPVAVSLPRALDGKDLRTIVTAFHEVSLAFVRAHSLGVAHRDVKPDNMFKLGKMFVVGDFGLATFPGKQALTASDRKLGPTFFIAPEMLNAPAGADGMRADVYSFAKALWVVATGQNYPIPGQHRVADPLARVSTYVPGLLASRLDTLLEPCTALDPLARPPMFDVCEQLREALLP